MTNLNTNNLNTALQVTNFDFCFLGKYFIIEVILIEIWVDFLWFTLRIDSKKWWALCWYEFDDKNYDFDRVVLLVDLIWLKSIDFTGVLNDFEIVFLVVC